MPPGVLLEWIQADLANPVTGVEAIAASAPPELDVLIYNIGIWKQYAFTEQYAFLSDSDASISRLVNMNITATLLLLKRLIPKLLGSSRPQIILTGSSSALRQSGRPEVTFGATKAALNGIADALRESFRQQNLAVTVLQLGYLNTDDPLSTPMAGALERSGGERIPIHG